MELIISKRPKRVTIIEGFPGFGLVGTIVTEFLLDHLQTEQIGYVAVDAVPAMVAIHGNKVMEPISIHYNKKYNLIIVQAITIGNQLGWDIGEIVRDLARQLSAREIVSLEGVGATKYAASNNVFYYTTINGNRKVSLNKIAKPLEEGIVVGVTGALLTREKRIPVTALFAEVQSRLPDSNAAAKIIQALDAYLGLDVDPAPLKKQAQEFERKLKSILEQTKNAEIDTKRKHLSYVG